MVETHKLAVAVVQDLAVLGNRGLRGEGGAVRVFRIVSGGRKPPLLRNGPQLQILGCL